MNYSPVREKSEYGEAKKNKFFRRTTVMAGPSTLLLAIAFFFFGTRGKAFGQVEQTVKAATFNSWNEVTQQGERLHSTLTRTTVGVNNIEITGDLGIADADGSMTLASGAPGAVPILSSSIFGRCKGDSLHGSRSNTQGGSSSASVLQTITDTIRFAKTRPLVDEFGLPVPEYLIPIEFISFSIVISGLLCAEAPIERIRELVDFDGEEDVLVVYDGAKALVSHNFKLSAFGGGTQIIRSTHHRAAAGFREKIPSDEDCYDETILIEQISFNSEEALKIEMQSFLAGNVNAFHHSQSAFISGDVSQTIYFTGFKFYDALGNPIPDGFYSAIGVRGIDWTLSNLPVGIKVIEAGRDQDNFTIRFTGPAGEVGWLVKASTDLVAFSLDLTPVSAITETIPGTYEAVIDVSGQGDNLFVRVEREVEAEVPEAELLLEPE